ncbi:Txe/YoeB family addiction module toxin [Mucilaginibacter phenanthrenivorans]|uniref:Txe/YoeB family addiction module toxin n=1 Tax=Mucilaginibacter phenanthrenivorans TaxID=1234842 RepID=UPI002157B59B|nr:Txe/YoeB family addiction module toxin [Mucilaginibacter phenanthrenivorans]
MRELHFMPKAWQDLGWWVKNDLKGVKKIHSLLESCCKTPFEGIGQPEPLKANYSGYWSRRINLEHRIVYKVEELKIVVHSLHGHYQD